MGPTAGTNAPYIPTRPHRSVAGCVCLSHRTPVLGPVCRHTVPVLGSSLVTLYPFWVRLSLHCTPVLGGPSVVTVHPFWGLSIVTLHTFVGRLSSHCTHVWGCLSSHCTPVCGPSVVTLYTRSEAVCRHSVHPFWGGLSSQCTPVLGPVCCHTVHPFWGLSVVTLYTHLGSVCLSTETARTSRPRTATSTFTQLWFNVALRPQ